MLRAPSPLGGEGWGEGNPGCTFSRDDDGKYRYGIWSDEAGIVMAVPLQQKRQKKY